MQPNLLWLRSFFAAAPPGRSYVTDSLPRLDHEDGGYGRALAGVGESFVLVEWDLAIEPEDMVAFEAIVARAPARVHAAPFRLYPRSTGLPGPVWAHRKLIPGGRRWVEEGEEKCDWFSLGLTYFPGGILRAAAPTLKAMRDDRSVDAQLSAWHYPRYGPVPIAWEVRPKHLNW